MHTKSHYPIFPLYFIHIDVLRCELKLGYGYFFPLVPYYISKNFVSIVGSLHFLQLSCSFRILPFLHLCHYAFIPIWATRRVDYS